MKTNGRGVESPRNPKDSVEGALKLPREHIGDPRDEVEKK
jgi:hypothetical protein